MPGNRVALISYHTCPLEQPGIGDSGGMNVYVKALATALTHHGVACDIFTRRTSPQNAPVVVSRPGVRVFHIDAGPPRPAGRDDLHLYLPAFLSGVAEVADACLAEYSIIHAHYWLSALAGRVLARRWQVPLVQTFHTLAHAKNASLAPGEAPEGAHRIAGEKRAIASADLVIATTAAEADLLVAEYDASPRQVVVVRPGVDPTIFSPGDKRLARDRVGIESDEKVLLVAGRIQPLKGIDIAIRALGHLVSEGSTGTGSADRISLVVVGGPSGPLGEAEAAALVSLAESIGVADRVDFRAALPQADLADLYRAADLVLVPSRSESFGLVALEAQACGTPVVVSSAGGLPEVVADGASGEIVPTLDPVAFADAIRRLLADPERRIEMGERGLERAAGYSWRSTAKEVVEHYDSLTDGQGESVVAERTGSVSSS